MFQKLLSYLKSGASNFRNSKGLQKKLKFLKLGQKIRYLGIFGVEFEKNYCLIWNQHPEIFLIEKCLKKKWKYLNFELKMPYLGSFGANFPKNNTLVWNQHTEICQFGKFRKKTMMSKVVIKNVLFVLFCGIIFKK